MITNDYFSFSKLDKFNQCPFAFKLKYEDAHFSETSSLAMEIGTIAHKCKELIALDLMAGRSPDYREIERVLFEGYDSTEDDVKSSEHNIVHILGINELKKKYPFDWIAPDNKSGMDYDQKIGLFRSHLKDMEKDTLWRPIAAELPFEFIFDGEWIIKGFIDKVEKNQETGELRIVDYKTSKAIFDEKKVKTSMQMIIYDMAIRNIYHVIPSSHLFDFIFIGQRQHACSPGYYERGEKKLREWFAEIKKSRETGEYIPKPSPLCHWCDYCKTNSNAQEDLKYLCPYYSLWTPTNKTYKVFQVYNNKPKENEKKIDFWF